jgi:hypothetical protein
VIRSAEEFRRQADACRRLSVRLKHPEHQSFALELAGAWTALAKRAEAKQAATRPRLAVLLILAAQIDPLT